MNVLKPLCTKDVERMSVSELVSMGILPTVTCRINMLAYVVDLTYPAWVTYIFYALTGIALGRGTNLVYDLWKKLKEWKAANALPIAETAEVVAEKKLEAEEVDLEVTHWPLNQLLEFARLNGFVLPVNMPADEEKAKAYLIECMFGPDEGDASEQAATEQRRNTM